MNLDRLITMIVNQITRRVVNIGVNKGISHFSGKAKPARPTTELDRQQARASRDIAKRARQAAKLTRRLGR